MLIYFLSGLIVGGVLVWVFYFATRGEVVRIEEEKEVIKQERQIVIEFMHNLVEAIGEGVHEEQLYQKIVHTAILSSGALSACLFEITEENKLKGIATEGLFPPQRALSSQLEDKEPKTRAEFIESILKSETFTIGEGLIGSVAQTQKAVLIKNALKDPRVIKHADSALEVNSMIVAPIFFRKTLLGVLAVANPVDSIPFNENDLSLVKSLAEQAGMAIHNLKLMTLMIEKKKLDFDLALASNIQGMLLPQSIPKINELEIAAYYQPAQKVGGDLYDIIPLSKHRLGIAIADVSGKGIPASLLMAICQTNLRHFARKKESPKEVLMALNEEIYNEINQDMFITMTYVVIDIKKNELRFARAGHEKPLFIKYLTDEDCFGSEKVDSQGIALGMVSNEIFSTIISEAVRPFNEKDALILYTDGVTEAINKRGEEYGFDRLAIDVLKSIHLTPEKINKQIITQVEMFSYPNKNFDDYTLVTIKHT